MDNLQDWLLILAAFLAPVITLWIWKQTVSKNEKQENAKYLDERLLSLSRDIEGNTTICLRLDKKLVAVEAKLDNVVDRLDKHEESCSEKWKTNFAQHDEFRDRISTLEGAGK